MILGGPGMISSLPDEFFWGKSNFQREWKGAKSAGRRENKLRRKTEGKEHQ